AANGTLKGTVDQPDIDGNVTVLDGSELTYVVPAAEAGAAERAGIVEFIDVSADSLNRILKRGIEEAVAQSGAVTLDLDATITVTDEASFTILIDPVTGDRLEVRGNGTLLTGMRPTGDMSLSGRFDVTDGTYFLSFYNIVSREFDITDDSYIVWNGDPLDATINMTAIYTTRAAPLELVATEVGGLEQAEQNRFRTQLPFQVYINLEGDMFKPEIDFDIQLPENERSAMGGQVEAKLQQLRTDEAEQNKQVFALIVLGRFLAPDPLQSSGGGLAATARGSVSDVLTDQLNSLTNKYAGGLGLELGVNSYEDYSSGDAEGRTDLNVALRQQLFNDRLIVRLGTDVGLEGNRSRENTMSDFGGDVSIEYLLTADGRLRVRAFRRNEYEGFLEGDVLETGGALIYQRDYNNFSDLFRSLESRQKKREERLREERL
ncbi:MAG: translocation/assembly module TamB, partial [Hymenobacteraceae bacterium]|nr:translocation/assembly module TamB [Hymenobacteraceae bacterium]MDX5395908.1 translocation/assembly module TamB [Hymenobacteraceae bacterium]MDX5511965.1 translocation/assembly module TamB [Hymenobacteraceae bacterium]